MEIFGNIENIMGKGENAGHQHFLLFSIIFSKASFPRVFKRVDCVGKGLFKFFYNDSSYNLIFTIHRVSLIFMIEALNNLQAILITLHVK